MMTQLERKLNPMKIKYGELLKCEEFLWSLQGLRKLLMMSICDRDVFGNCGVFMGSQVFFLMIENFRVHLRTSCCWMTEITVLFQARIHGVMCVCVGILEDLSIVCLV